MSERMPKVNELIRQCLGQIFCEEIEWPENILVTITKVETTRDLKRAVVWVSIMPIAHGPAILKKLAREIGYLQHLLNQKVCLKFTPKLRFEWDKTEEEAVEIEELFKQIREEK